MSGTDLWATDGGVYFGNITNGTEWGANTKVEEEWRYIGDRHLLSIGPNGSGKSRRVLLPNLALLTGWSIVVVDPKGELARMTLKHRKDAGNHIIVLDPFEAGGFETDTYNPLSGLDLDDDDFVDDVMGLAEAMIRVEGRDPHWPASAQDLVAACMMGERVGRGKGGSLEGVRSVLGLATEKFSAHMEVLADQDGMGALFNCPELIVKAGRFVDSNREIRSIQSSALTQTRWLDSRPIKKNLHFAMNARQVDFAQLKKKPTTVYIILPARRLVTHSVWMRIIIASILQPLLKDTATAKVPVMLMLDEFPALAAGDGFPAISNNMAMFRGYGIKLWTVWQDLNQAQRIYGDGWQSFVANAGVLHSFAPQDAVTADYLSKLMPLAPHTKENRTRSLGGQGSKASELSYNVSASEEGMPIMLPQHLRNMDDGFSVLFSHNAKGPMRRYFPWKRKGLEHIYALDPAATQPR